MDITILLLIVIIGFFTDNRKKKKKTKKAQKKKNADINTQRQMAQKPVETVQQMMETNMTQKQRELKHRLQQKYADALTQSAKKNSKTEQKAAKAASAKRNENRAVRFDEMGWQEDASIMQRAAETVKNDAVDELRLEMEQKQQSYDGFSLLKPPESSELIKQIEDLMIKGYTADMSSGRDFVAEGVSMLNQYEMLP